MRSGHQHLKRVLGQRKTGNGCAGLERAKGVFGHVLDVERGHAQEDNFALSTAQNGNSPAISESLGAVASRSDTAGSTSGHSIPTSGSS